MKLLLISIALGLGILFMGSLDFTPTINKEIVEAQEFLLIQNYEKSIAKYKEILKKNPGNELKVKIYYQLGEIYSTNLGKNKEAIGYFTKVKELTEDPLFLVKSEERIGEIAYSFSKDFKKSFQSYKNLSEFTPKLGNFDFYQFRMAVSAFKKGDINNSVGLFEDIQRKSSHKYFISSFYYLGLINFHRKQWNRSLVYLKEFIKRESKKDLVVQAKFLMANIYESKEELKTAYDLYYSILGKYPNTQVVQNRLKSIYSRRIARKR
ncbi:MAG: tetratricopeptide repeat protein [Bacteriovoracaceae bacterium]|nr:tetratricopeptide repeat protein [Bacteriovoracaceae bacterium]